LQIELAMRLGGVLDNAWDAFHTEISMQLRFRSRQRRRRHAHAPATLLELHEGEHGILDRLEVPEDVARRLMELGFLPGSRITAARTAPGGDPRVFRVDGSEVALRRETARHLKLRPTRSTKR
jgi:ferrous iron transport protein A